MRPAGHGLDSSGMNQYQMDDKVTNNELHPKIFFNNFQDIQYLHYNFFLVNKWTVNTSSGFESRPMDSF